MLANADRRETAFILLDQACVSGGNFLTALVLARAMNPVLYGKFSLILLFLYAINTCHSSLIVYPLILRVASTTSRQRAEGTLSALMQAIALVVPLAAMCVAFSVSIGESGLALLIILAMAAWQLQETTRRALLASRNAGKAILPDMLCFVGQGALLFALHPQSIQVVLHVIVLTSAVAFLWQAILLRLKPSLLDLAAVKRDARVSWVQGRHILGGNAFNMVALQLPSWTLALFGGPVAVAGYQALLNLAGIANPIIFSVNTALIPTVARSAADGYIAARKSALRVGLQYGALLLPCFLALGVLPRFVMQHVYGPNGPYLYLSSLLPVFITAYAIQYVATVIGAYEGGMSRPESYFRVQAVSTVVLGLLCLPLIRMYGVRGAVLSVLGFSVFRAVGFAVVSIYSDWKANSVAHTPTLVSPDEAVRPSLAVCILTYRRQQSLALTLESLQHQTVLAEESCHLSIVVIDNDAAGTAQSKVESFAAASALQVAYFCNPANGLSTGRNLAMEKASDADFVAFLDDDEVASPDWLSQLLRTATLTGASVVTGPVDPLFSESAPWVQQGGFFSPPRHNSGDRIAHAASNNVLLRRDVVTAFRFDPHFDTTGGEDTDFFLRVRGAGHSLVWCEEARVQEWVPASRANQAWILKRARSDANRFTRAYLRLHGGVMHKGVRVLKATGGLTLGALTFPRGIAGKHRRVQSLRYFARAIGTWEGLRGRASHDYGPRIEKPQPVPVLVVGQTPPPLNGQTLMIREFVNGTYSDIEIAYVPMRFSRSTNEIGRLDWRKPFVLFATILNIYRVKLKSRASILYYPPAGANLVPVVRDLVLLLACRPLFRKTVFHFHAAGLSRIYPQLPRWMKPLFRKAYGVPEAAIFTTEATSGEAAFLHAQSTHIVPCGVPDPGVVPEDVHAVPVVSPHILFAGIVCEDKGVKVLLEACALLRSRGCRFTVGIMGAFQTAAFSEWVNTFLSTHNLQKDVVLYGTLSGNEKHAAFQQADIFCFPSHYPAESFGVVLIEAMSYGLPIVATDWQGIPEVTDRSGEGSVLVPVQDPATLAGALEQLLTSETRRQQMGRYNRRRYLRNYTLDQYRLNLSSCLASLA